MPSIIIASCMVRFVSERVAAADPHGLVTAGSAMEAFECLGSGRQAVSPAKAAVYTAYKAALQVVSEMGDLPLLLPLSSDRRSGL